MSFFRTPQHGSRSKGDPVFKTPMTFSPRITGDQARPSPSRFELWKEQLGLDDTTMQMEGDSGESCSDNESDKENQQLQVSYTMVEFKAMEKELEERNSQRDDLLLKLNVMSDNLKQYKTKLEREESNKKQQIKILKKTSEVAFQEKDNLIRNLESITEEQDIRITELENQVRDGKQYKEPLETKGLHLLVRQIEDLQEKNSTMYHSNLSLEAKVEELSADLGRLHQTCTECEREKNELQEEVIKLRTTRGSGNTDDQKLVHKLESENDSLRKNNHNLEQEKNKLQVQIEQLEQADDIQKLKGETERQRQRVQELERELRSQVDSKQEDGQETAALKDKVKLLSEENQTLSQDVRALNAKLLALQAKSPEVVTKVKTVEVESEDLKREFEELQSQVSELQQQNSLLQTELQQSKEELHRQLARTQELQGEAAKKESQLFRQQEDLQAQMKSLQENLKCSEEESKKQDTRQEQLQAMVKNLEHANSLLKEENDNATNFIEQLQNEIEKYKNGRIELEKQMAEEVQFLQQNHQEQLNEQKQAQEAESHAMQEKLHRVQGRLAVIAPNLAELIHDYKSLQEDCRNMPTFIADTSKSVMKECCKAISEISKHNQELVQKYRKEMALRKKYHNELVDLKGKIRVFGRVRPLIKEDGQGIQAKNVVAYDADDDAIVNVLYKARVQNFELDRVFHPDVSQQEVFDEVQNIVTSCIDGYNVCIFAYGQTGSGKTHTMEGTLADPGINQRALAKLFKETHERSVEVEYTISVSVLEIYNETIRDLLSSDHTTKLDIKMNPEGGGLHVPGLNSVEVTSVDDVNEVFATGRKNRATASTNMNEHSSRSHALLCVSVVGRNIGTGAKTIGKLNLVDLAGSERVSKSGADGARLKEAQSINKSLSCLGDVIHSLRSKQPHVPYRNSKLTYLLQESLGGDSKTLMIVQLSPVEKNVGETLASLSFAQRVRAVELGQASKKTESAEVAELRDRLAQYEDMAQFSPGHQKSMKPPSKIARRK